MLSIVVFQDHVGCRGSVLQSPTKYSKILVTSYLTGNILKSFALCTVHLGSDLIL